MFAAHLGESINSAAAQIPEVQRV